MPNGFRQSRDHQLVRRCHELEDQLAATRKHADEFTQETADRIGSLYNLIGEIYRDLDLLHADLANGCSVEVAGRELVRTLQMIRQFTDEQRKGQEGG